MTDVNFPQDFYLDDVGVWRLKKEKLAELEKPKPITNEEWIKSLDTEGLVDYLYEVHKGGNSVERQKWIENHKERVKMQFRGWLKEIHDDNMGRNP